MISISCSRTMGIEAFEVSFFGRVLPIPPYLVIRTLGRKCGNDHGTVVPKLVCIDRPDHAKARRRIFLMKIDGWWKILTTEIS
jgi:hypothetical protein